MRVNKNKTSYSNYRTGGNLITSKLVYIKATYFNKSKNKIFL